MTLAYNRHIGDCRRWQGALMHMDRAYAALPPDTDFSAKPCMLDLNLLNPLDSQHGDSCVAYSWCRAVEAEIRRQRGLESIARGWRLDEWKVYERARADFWPGRGLTGGLFPEQGVETLKAMGIIPPQSTIRRVAPTWAAICAELHAGTIMVHCILIHDGVARYLPNGVFDHAPRPDNRSGGHQVVVAGTHRAANEQGDSVPMLAYAQSWGRNMYWNGIMSGTFDECREIHMDGPFAIDYAPVQMDKWEGFRKWLIR